MADEFCPTGQIGIVNSETRVISCIPAEELAALKQTSQEDAQKSAQGAPETQPPEDSPSPSTLANPTLSANEPTQTSEPIQEADIIKYDPATQENQRIQSIHNAITTAGWSIEGGAGLSYSTAVDFAYNLKISGGYSFNYPKQLAFGLYLDANFRPYEVFSTDITLVPKLHVVSQGLFRFSLGLGIGTEIDVERTVEEKTSYDTDGKLATIEYETNKAVVSLVFKPSVDFIWFITRNTWLGFGFDLPLALADESGNYNRITFNTNFSFGYKFI